jgi:hypothetical protein
MGDTWFRKAFYNAILKSWFCRLKEFVWSWYLLNLIICYFYMIDCILFNIIYMIVINSLIIICGLNYFWKKNYVKKLFMIAVSQWLFILLVWGTHHTWNFWQVLLNCISICYIYIFMDIYIFRFYKCYKCLYQGASRRITDMEWDKFWVVNKKVIDPMAPRFFALDAARAVPLLLHGLPFEGTCRC